MSSARVDTAGHVLVLGGARSGKSRRAEALAAACRRPVLIATAESLDAEMADRIARHRADRGDHWQVAECPLDVASALLDYGRHDARADDSSPRIVVVDCLTLWLSNLMGAGRDPAAATGALIAALAACRQNGTGVVLVSNEVGLGLVPETPLGRAFRDEQGRLNQRIAEAVARVEFVVAGHSLVIRPAPGAA